MRKKRLQFHQKKKLKDDDPHDSLSSFYDILYNIYNRYSQAISSYIIKNNYQQPSNQRIINSTTVVCKNYELIFHDLKCWVHGENGWNNDEEESCHGMVWECL